MPKNNNRRGRSGKSKQSKEKSRKKQLSSYATPESRVKLRRSQKRYQQANAQFHQLIATDLMLLTTIFLLCFADNPYQQTIDFLLAGGISDALNDWEVPEGLHYTIIYSFILMLAVTVPNVARMFYKKLIALFSRHLFSGEVESASATDFLWDQLTAEQINRETGLLTKATEIKISRADKLLLGNYAFFAITQIFKNLVINLEDQQALVDSWNNPLLVAGDQLLVCGVSFIVTNRVYLLYRRLTGYAFDSAKALQKLQRITSKLHDDIKFSYKNISAVETWRQMYALPFAGIAQLDERYVFVLRTTWAKNISIDAKILVTNVLGVFLEKSPHIKVLVANQHAMLISIENKHFTKKLAHEKQQLKENIQYAMENLSKMQQLNDNLNFRLRVLSGSDPNSYSELKYHVDSVTGKPEFNLIIKIGGLLLNSVVKLRKNSQDAFPKNSMLILHNKLAIFNIEDVDYTQKKLQSLFSRHQPRLGSFSKAAEKAEPAKKQPKKRKPKTKKGKEKVSHQTFEEKYNTKHNFFVHDRPWLSLYHHNVVRKKPASKRDQQLAYSKKLKTIQIRIEGESKTHTVKAKNFHFLNQTDQIHKSSNTFVWVDAKNTGFQYFKRQTKKGAFWIRAKELGRAAATCASKGKQGIKLLNKTQCEIKVIGKQRIDGVLVNATIGDDPTVYKVWRLGVGWHNSK